MKRIILLDKSNLSIPTFPGSSLDQIQDHGVIDEAECWHPKGSFCDRYLKGDCRGSEPCLYGDFRYLPLKLSEGGENYVLQREE